VSKIVKKKKNVWVSSFFIFFLLAYSCVKEDKKKLISQMF
jgi:hypothetical protein